MIKYTYTAGKWRPIAHKRAGPNDGTQGLLPAETPAAATGYTLTAEAGSFTFTGQPAGLLRGLRINAEPGAFTLTGQPAGSVRSYRLVAEPGSFVLAGQDAGLTYSGAAPETPAEQHGGSAWRWSEYRTVPLEHYRLTAETGRFTLIGGPVRFVTGLSPAALRRRQTAAVLLLAA